jgi:succinyl-diaminopimelate desuccinylase
MSAKSEVFTAIEASRRGIVELETLLSAVPAIAPESGGKGEWDKALALETWLRGRGIVDIEWLPAPDERVPGGKRPNIVATIKGRGAGPRVWIMSHLDVVPEGDRSLWETDPFKVVEKDGKVYGRGVEDNQQGLVASVFAALALLSRKIVPPGDVKLLFVADEEVGSAYGIQYLLKAHSLFRPDDLIVIPDGGAKDGSEIEVSEKNLCWLKVHTKGRQCHGSTPDEGKNAFLAGCEAAIKIHALENYFMERDALFDPDRSTFSPTKKEANVPNINTIPADDVFYVDMRILPVYPVDRVMIEVDRIFKEVEVKYGVTMSREFVQKVESKGTPKGAPVVEALANAIKEVYGVEARPIGIGGGTVGAYLRNAGYDCVVWSKLDETAHQPNEHASIDNIVGDAKVMSCLMLGE